MNYVLTIAGFDPSAGAGVLADIKTIEQQEDVYGFGVCTSLTAQTEDTFTFNQWVSKDLIKEQLQPLLQRYPIKACKIGIMPSLQLTIDIIEYVRQFNEDIQIVVDPIWKATAGFDFQTDFSLENIIKLLEKIDLLTPNRHEFEVIQQVLGTDYTIQKVSQIGSSILLKGGHSEDEQGIDRLYINGFEFIFKPTANPNEVMAKHGSGCVLSAAITANLAKDYYIVEAVDKAKKYTELYLKSSSSLLGSHRGIESIEN